MPSLRPVAAVRIGSKYAASRKTFVVSGLQPVASPPMIPAIPSGPESSAITVISEVERVGLAVERFDRLAIPRKARVDRALHLVGVEDVERAGDSSW